MVSLKHLFSLASLGIPVFEAFLFLVVAVYFGLPGKTAPRPSDGWGARLRQPLGSRPHDIQIFNTKNERGRISLFGTKVKVRC